VRFTAVLLVVAACGDNTEIEPDGPDAPRCAPTPGPLPTVGHFLDPLAADLALVGCVEGGLEDLPGRWFVRAPESIFSYSYPKFEGTCETGFKRTFLEDDIDESDGVSRFSWTDGTRLFQRRTFVFETPDATFEFTSASLLCMRSDGTLTGLSLQFDNDFGETKTTIEGTRFGLKDEPSKNLDLVGQLGAFGPNPEDRIVGFNVVIDQDLAYVVGPAGLSIIDVSTPATPALVSHVPGDDNNGGFNDVRVVRTATSTVAYASPIGDAGTEVVDVTNPANPVLQTALPYSHSVHVVPGATTQLYLANYSRFIPQYNVTNPLTPVLLGQAEIESEIETGVHDLYVDGNTIIANYTDTGMVALDMTPGIGNSTELGRVQTSYSHASWVMTTTGGKKVILHGDEGLSGNPDDGAAFLRILDGDPTSKTYLSELSRFRTRKEVGIHNIMAVGDRVYLSYYQDGVRVLDIADPTQPVEVAHFNTWDPETAFGSAFEGAVGVRVANDLVFVADLDRGLLILEETK
jgi:hypothetical protein